jgi:hypothetical protein
MSSATAAMTTLTPAFIHYFPSRNAITDPYSCFVYLTAEMTVALGGGAPSHFTLSYPKKAPNLTFHNDPFKRSNIPAGDYSFRRDTYLGTFRFKPVDPATGDHERALNVHQWDIDVRDSSGAKIPVLVINNVNRLFKATLKRNLLLYAAAGVTVSSRNPEPIAAVAPPATASMTQIQHVASAPAIPTPKLKAKKVPGPVHLAPAPAPPKGDLCLFVAKQLLELAQLKKDMCPITAEEYYTGETAVMPCGHLFMRIAIEESFKKEHSKCPACRQPGRPTYV